jgi:hypothetical protein
MSLRINSDFNGVTDPDAGAYIAAVEAADGNQLLEFGVGKAINDFVIGCKQDGIWTAIKASCILAGARTLTGALVPLVGTAPTNFNFVTGDYSRKTGLLGNGSSKYLNTNRNNNADPSTSNHIAAYITQGTTQVAANTVIGAYTGVSDAFYIGTDSGNTYQIFNRSIKITRGSNTSTGLIATSRASSSQFSTRFESTTVVHSIGLSALTQKSICVLGDNGSLFGPQKVAFYSIGESLDLALLDARVTALITAFGVAIP